MNQEQPPQDRTQDKADILESNLYNAISKQNNPITLQFQINRETAPDPVIVKALIQLFPRLNIKAPKIILLIRKLLLRKIPEGEELKISKQILSLADQPNPEMRHLGITLRAIVTAKRLAIEIKGVEPIPHQDGAVGKAFFDYDSCPGAFKADGSIDFKEINRFPIVKEGDNLFFITPEVQGRSGMRYDGKVIPVPQAQPLIFHLKDGVETVDSLDKDGQSRGYFLRAVKTGVVLLGRTDGQISDLEIRDALDVKRLDYSTGNIGTNFICPISMKIDTICNDFRIRAKGTVETGELEGGHIETDSHATVHTAHPGSSIRAREDIVVHIVRNSLLSSEKGYVTITDEAVDSRIDAVGIQFDKYKGVLSGNTLDAEHITLANLFCMGENTIHFGRRLFTEKQDLIKARAKIREAGAELKKKEEELQERLHSNIKALSKILKNNPLLRDNIRAFILATQAMDYDTLYAELAIISQTMNTKEVEQIKRCLDHLRRLPEEALQNEAKDKAMAGRIREVDKVMSNMVLKIEILLRRAATIRIFTPEDGPAEKDGKETEPKPRLFIESKSEKDTLVKIQGSYNRTTGFSVVQV